MPHLQIEKNSRTFVAGQTGSGKTRFCIELLSKVDRLIVIDVKYNLKDKMNLVSPTRKAWRNFIGGKPIRLQIPGYEFIKNPFSSAAEYYEDVFRKVWIAGDCILYIDELGIVTDGSSYLPPNLKKLYIAGREAIEDDNVIVRGNIGIVAAAQRPAFIPGFAITESQNCACFYLGNPDDRDRLAKQFGMIMRDPVPDEHGFYWRDATMRDPVYYSGLSLTDADNA